MSLLLLLGHLATNYSRASFPALPTNSNDLSTLYARSEYATVAADDSTYTSINGAPYLIHQFRYQAPNSTQAVSLSWNGNSTLAPSTRPVYLQIFNVTSQAWETIASNTTAAANTDFTLTGGKTSGVQSYYDANSFVVGRVYQ